MFICHKCDNPSCVNPHHLFEGTNQDNMSDMMNKGRHVCNPNKGIKNHASKLTEAEVKEIRIKYNKKAKITQQVLADEYGVSRRSIGNIIKSKIWKHVE
jgi:DNA-binding transcriptional regulator YiaG